MTVMRRCSELCARDPPRCARCPPGCILASWSPSIHETCNRPELRTLLSARIIKQGIPHAFGMRSPCASGGVAGVWPSRPRTQCANPPHSTLRTCSMWRVYEAHPSLLSSFMSAPRLLKIRSFLALRGACALRASRLSVSGHLGRTSTCSSTVGAWVGGGSAMPSARRSQPAQATMTPLSVHRSGGGTTSSTCAALATRASAARSAAFRATPPARTRCRSSGCETRVHSRARFARCMRCVSAAVWNDAATSHTCCDITWIRREGGGRERW